MEEIAAGRLTVAEEFRVPLNSNHKRPAGRLNHLCKAIVCSRGNNEVRSQPFYGLMVPAVHSQRGDPSLYWNNRVSGSNRTSRQFDPWCLDIRQNDRKSASFINCTYVLIIADVELPFRAIFADYIY